MSLMTVVDFGHKRLWMIVEFNNPIHVNIPTVVNTAFLQHVQVCMCGPGHVKKCQWDWGCFFFRHAELNSKFDVMTTDEVTLNRLEVGTGFSVIFCFCRLRPLRVSLKFFPEIFTPNRLFPPRSLGLRDLLQTILLFHPRSGI